jgi:RNA polymerase sigma-70 factor (ECF subfamily)
MATSDFDREIETHRRELHVHCYRMLGSFTDAEDLVQETYLRAWRSRGDYEAGSNLRAWLYRIATNVCIDAIRSRRRQVSASGNRAEATWLEPYPDLLLDVLPEPADAPDAMVVARETMELAFIASIQALPARQRAVLILHASLGWSPAETAGALGMTPAAVNSALQRARATLRVRLPDDRGAWSTPGLSDDERVTLRRFIDFHERGDAVAALALMHDDLVHTMPPDPRRLVGKARQVPLIDVAFGPDGLGDWKLVAVRANRQPATASYLRRPGDDSFRAFKLDVLRIVDGQVAENITFGSQLFGAFELPAVWSGDLRQVTSSLLDPRR